MSVQTVAQPFTAAETRAGSLNHHLVVAVQVGLIGGGVALLMCLEGMVEVLAARDIVGNIIAAGPALILITFMLSGQLALARAHVSARSGTAVMVGLAAGLVDSAMVAALLLAYGGLPQMRSIFVNTTPAMIKLLTFGQPLQVGIPLLLVLGALLGALPAALRFIPAVVARSLVIAAAALFLIALLQELVKVTAQNWKPLGALTSLLFAENGFTTRGAVGLFVLIFAISLIWTVRGKELRAGYARQPAVQRRALTLGALAVLVAFLLALPAILGLFFSEVLVNTGLYVLMALGLNIVVGFAGLLDLGYAAFFAIGAYTMGVLTSSEFVYHIGWTFWEALPVAVLAAITAGVMLGIPVLRIRGDYLAIVTLGFGEIIRLLATSDLLKPWLGDGLGLHGIPKPIVPVVGELSDSPHLYYLVLAGCLLVFFVARRMKNSRVGRAWIAVREDEDVAQAMGIDTVTTKLLAFAMGAAFGGLSGAIFASKLQTIYPTSFNLLVSINVLSVIIIGGMGSIPGVVVGALALVGIPELLREFSDFRLMLYGAVLVLMMLMRPEGLLPEARRREEMEEAREEATEETLVSVRAD
jgi:branched-chain amino acid transport system permease protein